MKLVVLAAALLIAGPPPAEAPEPGRAAAPAPWMPGGSGMPNAFAQNPACTPILRQVQEENKRREERAGEARTLGREPPAHLLLAVDRHVGGCREVTFLRRNVAPGTSMPQVDSGRK